MIIGLICLIVGGVIGFAVCAMLTIAKTTDLYDEIGRLNEEIEKLQRK